MCFFASWLNGPKSYCSSYRNQISEVANCDSQHLKISQPCVTMYIYIKINNVYIYIWGKSISVLYWLIGGCTPLNSHWGLKIPSN